MRLVTRARTSAALWAVLLLVPAVVAYVIELRQHTVEGYWVSASGAMSFGLVFIAPVCAVCAAWEAGRLRRGRVFAGAPVRGSLRVAVDALVPVLLLGVVGLMAGLATIWPVVDGAPGWPSPLIALTWAVVILGHTAWGFLLGRFLPLPAAIPTAAMTAYVWMVYPTTLSNQWIRHLNGGSLESCCGLDEEPSLRVVIGVCVLSVGFVLAVCVAVAGPTTAATYAIASAVFVVSATGGVLSVHTVDGEAVQTRSGGGTCSGAAPRVCLWPEQEHGAQLIGDQLRTAHAALVAVGVHVPATLTTTNTPGPDRLQLWFPAAPTRQEVVMGLAAGLLPGGPPECAKQGRGYDAWAAYAPTLAWLGLTAGAQPGIEINRFQPQDWELALRMSELPQDRQLTWYTTNSNALRSCDVPAAPNPDAPVEGTP